MQVKWAENCELLYIATVAMMSQLLRCHYDNISVMSSWPRCCSAHHLEKCFAMIPHNSLFVQLKMLKYNMDNQGTLNATHSLKTMSMFRGMLFIYFHWFWLKLMQFIIDLSSMFPVCQLKVRSTNLSQIPDLLFSSPPPQFKYNISRVTSSATSWTISVSNTPNFCCSFNINRHTCDRWPL